MSVCARKVCTSFATSEPHPDSGYRYCEPCRKRINDACGVTVIESAAINLPRDFGRDARMKAANCGYVLDATSADCAIKPGRPVSAQDVPGLVTSFGGETVRACLLGFTRPNGYACLVDKAGIFWNIHPAALTETR